MRRFRKLSAEEHVEILADFTIALTSNTTSFMRAMRFALEETGPAASIHILDRHREAIDRAFERYNHRTSGVCIEVPEDHRQVPFCCTTKRGVQTPVRKNPPIKLGVTAKLYGAGYECLHDLDGVTLGEIASIPYLGPSHLRAILDFLREEGLLKENIRGNV